MQRGPETYPRNPIAFLGGVQGLTARQIAVYAIVLDLVYQHGGRIHNDPRWISGWIADMGSAAVRRVIAELVDAGKLRLTAKGMIEQPRAVTELSGGQVATSAAQRAAARRAQPFVATDEELARAATLLPRILDLMGVDPAAEGAGRYSGTAPLTAISKWFDLGLDDTEILAVVQQRCASAREAGFDLKNIPAFDRNMARAANRKFGPRLATATGDTSHDDRPIGSGRSPQSRVIRAALDVAEHRAREREAREGR